MPLDSMSASRTLFEQIHRTLLRPVLNEFNTASPAIRPLAAVRISGGHARLIRIEFALQRRKHACRIGAGNEEARRVRAQPAMGVGPQSAIALRGLVN